MPGSQNRSPNSHKKSRRNALRVFDVCSEILCDSTTYFRFVASKFSELVHTEIATFSQFLRYHTAGHSLKYTKCPAVKELGEFLRIPQLQIQNNICTRFVIEGEHSHSGNYMFFRNASEVHSVSYVTVSGRAITSKFSCR